MNLKMSNLDPHLFLQVLRQAAELRDPPPGQRGATKVWELRPEFRR